MENGAGMVDDSVTVDNKIVDERVANDDGKEKVDGGLDETKDVKDDVFEEAIEAQENLPELTEISEMDNGSGVAGAIGNGDTNGDTDLQEVKENSNSESEAETFEEAVGFPIDVGSEEDMVPSEAGPQVDVVPGNVGPQVNTSPSEIVVQEGLELSVDEHKDEELFCGENVGGGVVSNKIDEGGTEMGSGTDELSGGKELLEIGSTGEIEVPRDENEGNTMMDSLIEKHVNGVADAEYLEGTLADKNLETPEVAKLEEDVKMDPKLEVLPQADKGEESPEGAVATDFQDKMAGATADTSAGMIGNEIEALHDKSANFDTGDQGKQSAEVKNAKAGLGSVDAGDEGEKATMEVAKVEEDVKMDPNSEVLPQPDKGEESTVGVVATDFQDKMARASADTSAGMIVNEIEALHVKSTDFDTGDQGKESAEVKDAKADLDSVDAGDEGEKAFKALATAKTVDNTNGEVKDSLDAEGLKNNCAVDKPEDKPSQLSRSVEGTVAPEVGDLLSPEKLRDQKNEKIEAGKSDLRSEVHYDSQSQLPDEMVDKVQDIKSSTEEPEKKSEKDQEDMQSTKVTRDQEVQQHAPVSSLSLKSEVFGKKADIVQAMKQNIPRVEEREISPTPVPSSSVRSVNSATPPHPAGLGRAAPLLEPAPRVVQQPRVNGNVSQAAQRNEDPASGEADESDETREKLQLIRVKFLRLAHRLGQGPHNVVVAQVLYRLGLAEQLQGRNGGRVGAFSFDRASAMAEQLEAAGNEPLDFSCTIMVLGKTGVGKSATINSIFDEVKFGTDAFQTGTKKVQDVVGTVHGIKVRIIDTPGLLPSWSDQHQNEKTLHSVKHFIKKTPPDIVLYLDRLDMQTRDFGDMPLLRTITEIFGPSIWFNAIVVLTHAASAPPDGPNGTASSYDMFVTQRTHVVQQAIRQAAGDMRLMNPVSLVENHSACRTNRAGQRVLPNGQVWKPHLLLLSFASKILAEANTLLKLQDTPPGKPFATQARTPPLPFLLSSLLQSRPQVKLPEEQQFGDEDGLDDDLVESSDSEDEPEYDELPPFKRLTKAQIAKLTKAQKKAYFDELEYREKLFMKKQLKEEKRQRKMMKKMAAAAKDLPSEYGDSAEEESSGASSVPVPMPDLALPASFDSDNPTHRYRYLDSSNPWLVRPVLDTHGWDHDVGYEGINMERLFVAKDKFPISFSGQITKDKKDANVQMELASSLKHEGGKATSLGFDMQTVGKDLAYTLRGETRFSNFRKNKANAGISLTVLGDTLSTGVKVEDKLIANKRFQVVMTGGAMTSRGDIAFGGSLEAQLRDKDYPLGRSSSTLGLSVMDWHGDLAIGCNIQSQVPVGRSTNLIARANLNNRGAGQVSIRINSSEQLQLALVSLLPLLKKVLGYSQQMQYGQ
ncbi:translocase of chloroplast 120, chloroplastic-like [Hibiscus syriacus]|uniref:translocase of chloroplast 120, chloroplastic-like n=1 Tax=Hibiscus syriacus TaxID=106335 RepID=UPI001921BC17|nr:translocase of chloroplast 120, chloroplastic-like [Hibiscus syriacus]